MEPQQNNIDQTNQVENNLTNPTWHAPLNRITSTSKVLAAIIFITLPFVGGYVGWWYGQGVNEILVETVNPISNAIEITEDEPRPAAEQVSSKYFLMTDGVSFEISTTSDSNKTVVYESKNKMFFGLPWVVNGDDSLLLKSDGEQVNGKHYINLWMQTAFGTSIDDLNHKNYSWHLGELDPQTGNFDLILDLSHLSLDDTYSGEALSFSPIEDYSNSDGHIVFSVVLCERCGPGPRHLAVLNYKTRELTLIGRATQFEWVNSSTYRYKTESELGVSILDNQTKVYVKEHYYNCADHPTICYQQIDWERMPWITRSI